jgi:hypothetical protein
MLPAIRSLSALNSGGRLGVVAEARPPAPPQDGRQLVALQLRTVDRRDAQGQAASRVSGLAPLPAEASEKPGASRRVLAAREDRAAALPRLPDQPAPTEREAIARLPDEISAPERATIARLPDEISAAEPEAVERLRRREAQLRQAESAHAAVAGDLAGPIEHVYRRGPDGRRYGVNGSAGIEATLASGAPDELRPVGERLAAAATAPLEPPAQDHAAARRALRLYAEAGQEPPPAPGLDLTS